MVLRFAVFVFLTSTLFSCQLIMRHHLGIKRPDIEKEKTVTNLLKKNQIGNGHFLQKDKLHDAYIGKFPKVFVFDKNGYEVILPDCYEVIEDNIKSLVDTIPDKLSAKSTRDKFVQETIQTEGNSLAPLGQYDYEVFFYWSVWLGKFNVKKLRIAQNTINVINNSSNSKKITLIPVNFDFIKESGWTKQSFEAEISRIGATQKEAKHPTYTVQSLNVAKAQLITVKKSILMVVANQQAPTKVDRYYVLQGATSKEQSIPKSILNESNDFVSLQSGSNFWVLTLAESAHYKTVLTGNAETKVFKGFGLAKYQESSLDYDTFIAELKSGKHDAKFK